MIENPEDRAAVKTENREPSEGVLGRLEDRSVSDETGLSEIQNPRSVAILTGLTLLWDLTLVLVVAQKEGYETYARRIRAIERRHGTLLPAERRGYPPRRFGTFDAYYLILAISGASIAGLFVYALRCFWALGSSLYLLAAYIPWSWLRRSRRGRG
jgi:hypothetical protein